MKKERIWWAETDPYSCHCAGCASCTEFGCHIKLSPGEVPSATCNYCRMADGSRPR